MLERFDRRSPTDAILKSLERDGGAIVEGFLAADAAAALAADFAPHLDAVDWGNSDSGEPNEFFGLRTKRLHGLVARSALVGELIVDPLLLAMCHHFLKPNGRSYRLSTGELIALASGQEPQALHRDADSWPYYRRPRPEILVSTNVALTDFSAQNGATVVVPGSHRWPEGRQPKDDETCQAIMPRGSVLLYSGDVLHGGGANRTGELRVGLYLGYLLSWLRPLENFLLTASEQAIRAAPGRAQRLLGITPSGWEVIP